MKIILHTLPALALLLAPSLADAHGFGRAGGGRAVAAPRGNSLSVNNTLSRSPTGRVTATSSTTARTAGPYGGSATRVNTGTSVGPRGTTVSGGSVGGVRVGPGGVSAGRAGGVAVTTPGGRTAVAGSAGGVRVGPGGVSAGRVTGGVGVGPGGVVAGGSRVGVTSGIGGVAVGASRGGIAVGPYGAVAGGSRAGVAVGGGTVVAGGTRGVYGRTGVVGHNTYYVNRTTTVARAGYVRGVNYGVFNRTWYTAHPRAWRPHVWATPTFWTVPTWTTVAPYVGLPVDTYYNYDYGSTIVYNDNRVYSNGTDIGSATDYTAQAVSFATRGRDTNPLENEEFQPLGAFGMIQGEEKEAQHIFQLALSKSGIVRGNYYNALTDQTTPVYGSVDKKSQRVAWSVGDKKDIVFEAGLGNLMQPETTALVHYGKERTIQMLLVRLEEQADGK